MNDNNNNYAKRQMYILGNLGLFYLIIIALFAIPLLATFVVVLIRGVLDFRYAIMTGGVILVIFGLIYLIKYLRYLFQKFRKDGQAARRQAKQNMHRGEPVQISVFNGLITLSYGGGQRDAHTSRHHLPHLSEPLLLSHETEGENIIAQLKTLSQLRAEGSITEEEFQKIKDRMMKTFDNSDKRSLYEEES